MDGNVTRWSKNSAVERASPSRQAWRCEVREFSLLAEEQPDSYTRERMGFFTDTTVCIGCKACEVACKEWNSVPEDGMAFTGMSLDNTVALGASTWRHVAFIEQ